MELLLIVAAVVLCIGLPALAGAYIIKEGINQAIEWKEQYQEELILRTAVLQNILKAQPIPEA